jgi:two-component system response regulator FixJ
MTDVGTQVCIVDDDEAIRESIRLLLYAAGLGTCCYVSADDYLQRADHPKFDCMLLDIRMPGMDGIEFFGHLRKQKVPFPVIFITGHGDIPLAVSAIKQGAFDFLTKPFKQGELLNKVKAAIDYQRQNRLSLQRASDTRTRVLSCTPREQDVMKLMIKGFSNKGIAHDLEISPRTVEIHRAHVMEKMQADSLPSLVLMMTEIDT